MPDAGSDCVTFHLADPDHALAGVTLVQELARPRLGPTFVRPVNGSEWVASMSVPDVERFEYLFELRHRDGRVETIPDPSNPLRAAGPFGDRSVVELPAYRAPHWVRDPLGPDGTVSETVVESVALRRDVQVVLWTSAGHDHDDELPLLLAHDGVEYALYSGLLALLGRAVAGGRLPPCHAALLVPAQRDDDYTASRAYARALAEEVIPGVETWVRTRGVRVGMGASLGGLAMLHAHRLHPQAFGALFLQSASLFLAGVDGHDKGLRHHARIVRFVRRVLDAPDSTRPLPIVMTCGSVEENLKGNRAVAGALHGAGYPVSLEVVRDAHNWTAWRDTFDPHLIGLLTRVWS